MTTPSTGNINAAAGQADGLHCYLNLGTLNDLPATSAVPDVLRNADWNTPTSEVAEALFAAGYTGIQGGSASACAAVGVPCTAGGAIHHPGALDDFAPRLQDEGYQAITLHVGTGLETDAEADALCEHVVATADRLQFPISIETHRATVTQDIRRTLDLVERHPDLRFNGDFSHWFTGLEMVYGDFAGKLDAIEPVLARTTHLHARIGTPGMIQAPLTGNMDTTWVGQFRDLWTRCFAAFQRQAEAGQILVFAPELLQPSIYYAPVDADGNEFSDRWVDAELMNQLARECWDAAREPATNAS